jgi:putative colanic acid biosynthesis acetyltransferase WcaF
MKMQKAMPEPAIDPLAAAASRLHPYRSPLGWNTQLGRAAWGVVWALLFRPSPRVCFGWRRMLLRLFGAHMARGTNVYPTTRIWAPWNLSMGEGACLAADVDCYCVDQIEIGANATVSIRSFLCTASHDIRDPNRSLTTGPIVIGPDAFIFAEAFVGPSVTIDAGAVLAARAVVVRDVSPWTVVAGNPAKLVSTRVLKPT